MSDASGESGRRDGEGVALAVLTGVAGAQKLVAAGRRRGRVGRAHGRSGWKEVGGGGMWVTTAVGNSRRPVRSSKWSVRPTTADSHPKTPPHG